MAEKKLIVVAGPNGAGKTTFAQEFLVERPMPYLSADAAVISRWALAHGLLQNRTLARAG